MSLAAARLFHAIARLEGSPETLAAQAQELADKLANEGAEGINAHSFGFCQC